MSCDRADARPLTDRHNAVCTLADAGTVLCSCRHVCNGKVTPCVATGVCRDSRCVRVSLFGAGEGCPGLVGRALQRALCIAQRAMSTQVPRPRS